jgi:dipeptidyl aminopeptidase/acylaminoacyl peptidase
MHIYFRESMLFCFTIFQLNAIFAQKGNEPVLVTDLLKVKAINSVTLTNDGKRAAYVVVSVIQDEKSLEDFVYQSQIWVVNTDSNAIPIQVSFAKEGASQPAWSPDGRTLAFVRNLDGKSQIFLLNMNGGEPRQLTKAKYGATGPVWSPDGKLIVFTASFTIKDYANDSILNPNHSIPPFPLEKPGLGNSYMLNSSAKPDANGTMEEVRSYLARNEVDKKAKVITKLQFHEEATTSGDWNITQVFITDIAPENKVVPVTSGFYSYRNPRFTGNSKSLYLESNRDSTRMPDRSLETEIWQINTDGTGLQKIAGEKEKVFGNNSVSLSGKWIAYTSGKTEYISIPSLEIMSMQPRSAPILIPYDRNKQSLTWSKNEKFLYFTSPSNGGVLLNRLDLATKQITALTTVQEGIGSFDVKDDKLVFVKTNPDSPFELYIADASAKNARAVTSLNSSWIINKRLSIPEKYIFTNNIGQEVEYWVMKPSNYQPGKKYPLLLEIHGGPSAMWGPGESSMWDEYQYFSSKGYGVVYCNPRGSGGYSETFLRGNINNWGEGPTSDVLTALDKTVAEGWADTSRLIITGGSYAGYLTAWIVGHDHRFKAACAQRGVYDLKTFFGEANQWRLVPNYFGGYPWQKEFETIIEKESPINYVQNITTPIIIFHGESDLRTGLVSGEQFYKSLKVMGKPAEYVRHPGATHEITRSGNNRQRIDQMLRTWEFFERYIRFAEQK